MRITVAVQMSNNIQKVIYKNPVFEQTPPPPLNDTQVQNFMTQPWKFTEYVQKLPSISFSLMRKILMTWNYYRASVYQPYKQYIENPTFNQIQLNKFRGICEDQFKDLDEIWAKICILTVENEKIKEKYRVDGQSDTEQVIIPYSGVLKLLEILQLLEKSREKIVSYHSGDINNWPSGAKIGLPLPQQDINLA